MRQSALAKCRRLGRSRAEALTSCDHLSIEAVCASGYLCPASPFFRLGHNDRLLFHAVCSVPYPDRGVIRRSDELVRLTGMPASGGYVRNVAPRSGVALVMETHF